MSYLGQGPYKYDGTAARRERLSWMYNFHCGCPLCSTGQCKVAIMLWVFG